MVPRQNDGFVMSPRRTRTPGSKPQARQTRRAQREIDDIRDLFSFQLQRLAGLSSRIAARSICPAFGLTLSEWRAIAVLGYLDETSLQELARHSGLLKSQMSRTVTGLIDRGLIERSANPEDGRSVLLRLSPEGARIGNEVLATSRSRNEHMLAALDPDERLLLMDLIGRVFQTSHAYYADLRRTTALADLDEVEAE